MIASRITPGIIRIGLAAEVLILTALYLPAAFGLTSRFKFTEAVVMTLAGFLAYGVFTLLSLKVAFEYRQARWAQVAWLLLSASAAISLVKRTAGSPLLDFVVQDYRVSPLRGLLDNLLVVPANLLLLTGLLGMWWAVHRVGLGFRIKGRDYIFMVGVVALFLTLLIMRESLSQGQSPFLLGRILQPVGLAFLGISSAFGVVLHRYAVQMGDGTLALVMRWLMIYVVLRGALVLSRGLLTPNLPLMLDSTSDLEPWIYDVLWQVVHWAPAMATAYRAQLTVSAAKRLDQLRSARAEEVVSV